MKDATGELSMTAIAVVAIAAIGVLFTTLIWPSIKTSIMRSTYCSSAFDCTCTSSAKMCTCYYCPSNASNSFSATCSSTAQIQCAPNNS